MLRVADHAARTDTGRARSANEDSYWVHSPLFVLADGMGGAQAGEVASQTAVGVFSDHGGLPDGPGTYEERLAALVAQANGRVYSQAQSDDQFAGMGTTLTVAYVGEDDLAIAHVGDSRFYVLRDGELEQLTDDHSLVGELVRRGQISAEEAEDHPQRSIITRALGIEGEVTVDHFSWPVRDGDVFLLCSDGLTGMVSDAGVAEILAGAPSLAVAAQQLVAAANEAGGRDNITVILFRVEDVTPGEGAVVNQNTSVGEATAAPAHPAAAPAAATQTSARPAEMLVGSSAIEPRAPRPPRHPRHETGPRQAPPLGRRRQGLGGARHPAHAGRQRRPHRQPDRLLRRHRRRRLRDALLRPAIRAAGRRPLPDAVHQRRAGREPVAARQADGHRSQAALPGGRGRPDPPDRARRPRGAVRVLSARPDFVAIETETA